MLRKPLRRQWGLRANWETQLTQLTGETHLSGSASLGCGPQGAPCLGGRDKRDLGEGGTGEVRAGEEVGRAVP